MEFKQDQLAYSVPDAAKASGYKAPTLYIAIKAGELKAFRVTPKGDLRVLKEDLIAWLKSYEVQADPEAA